jgi:glycosyltransferase involved in cell wall biosynthesis
VTKRVLLLAYMFPPIVDAGGFRPLAFARYLPGFGWDPIVLTRPDSGDLPLDPTQLETLPSSVRVERVPYGFVDAWHRHWQMPWARPVEALAGKPAGWLGEALAWRAAHRDPYRQWEVSWMQQAIDAGVTLIERYRPDAILASAPPFETLKAGWSLHQRTGVPLVADFRDPWTYGVLWNPSNSRRARTESAWEARVVGDAARTVVVTPSMQRRMAEKYPGVANRIDLVMNGYEDLRSSDASPPDDRFVLSYVGSIMERRFPSVLFEALRRLRSRHPAAAADFRVRFVGPNQCAFSLNERIAGEGLSDIVEYVGPVGHDRGRDLMRASHVLLHIETTADYAVSSKLFEYFSANRHILGIVPAGSDDESFLHRSGVGFNAGVAEPDAIAAALLAHWEAWKAGRPAPMVDVDWLGQFHRREQTRKLAMLLDGLGRGESAESDSTLQ